MIDVHCHLEQKDYDFDRQEVINDCKKELKAVIISCTHPNDFETGIKMMRENRNFLFLVLGLHPTYIKELSNMEIDSTISYIIRHKEEILGIGEIGLDYYWVTDEGWQKKQQELFVNMIRLAKKLHLPLVVHCRDAFEDTISILEKEEAKNVLMHHFDSHKFLNHIIENGWHISIGPNIKTSKIPKKLARDMPLERIMLETDAPWFGFGKRNTPLAIKQVAEEIAKIKKLSFTDIWQQTAKNAIKFFNLPVEI